jgi:hypothetical protein
MPVMQIGGDFVGRAEMLEAQHIDKRQRGVDDLVGDGLGGFVAVAENEVALVVAADGIVRDAMPQRGEIAILCGRRRF